MGLELCGMLGSHVGASLALCGSIYVGVKSMKYHYYKDFKNPPENNNKAIAVGLGILYGGLVLGPSSVIGTQLGYLVGLTFPITLPCVAIKLVADKVFAN